jgi:23S rRNA (cytosine1962-C5)-methyltransferase
MSSAVARAILKPGRDKSARRRHPWVFSGAIERVVGAPAPGATVEVCDAAGAFLAWAAYSPASQIRLRAWSFEAGDRVDASFFERRLAAAIEARGQLGLLDAQGACRLVFSESDGLPGLIVDRYGSYLVCQFLAAGAERWRDAIVDGLVRLLGPSGVFERSEAGVRRKEGLSSRVGVLHGQAPPSRLAIETPAGKRWVDLAHGQKTGGYLDQIENQSLVARHAAGAEMLDVFSYSGGFAVAGLRQGATAATLLDASAEALGLAEQVAAANGVSDRCHYRLGDAFTELRQLCAEGARYDLVVLDPPKFVHSAEQLNAGLRGYKDINWLGLRLVRPGGLLASFSCSSHVDREAFQRTLAAAAVDAGREARIVTVLGQAPDHPIALSFPESAYLKGLLLRVH